MEIPRDKAVEIICGGFKSILKDSKVLTYLEAQTPRMGIKLADFDVQGTGSFDRFSFLLAYDFKRKSSRLLLSVTNFHPHPSLEKKVEEGGTLGYERHGSRKTWRILNQVGKPIQYSDAEIANMLLDHNIEPGQFEKIVQEALV